MSKIIFNRPFKERKEEKKQGNSKLIRSSIKNVSRLYSIRYLIWARYFSKQEIQCNYTHATTNLPVSKLLKSAPNTHSVYPNWDPHMHLCHYSLQLQNSLSSEHCCNCSTILCTWWIENPSRLGWRKCTSPLSLAMLLFLSVCHWSNSPFLLNELISVSWFMCIFLSLGSRCH